MFVKLSISVCAFSKTFYLIHREKMEQILLALGIPKENVSAIIIIIMSHHQHGYPWPSIDTPLYRSLLPAGLQSYIPYRHRAAVRRFYLVVLPLLVHVKGAIGEHHLWARPYFSSMSGSSNFDSFRDGGSVAVQLLLCGVLPPGLVQYCSQHSCVVAVKLFLHMFS